MSIALNSTADGGELQGGSVTAMAINSSGIATFTNVPYSRGGFSLVKVAFGRGAGTTGVSVRCFSTVLSNIGTDITYTPDSVNGDYFTVNADGIYAMSYNDYFGAAGAIGITLNSPDLQGPVGALPPGAVLGTAGQTSSAAMNVAATVPLQAGAVLRAQSASGLPGVTNSSYISFTIARVA